MTHRTRILAALRTHGPLDDDRLAEVTGIRPRQAVNQVCRRLAAEGLLRRERRGPRGKLHNVLVDVSEVAQVTSPGSAPARTGPGRVERPLRPVASDAQPGEANAESAERCPPLDAGAVRQTLLVIPCSSAKRRGGDRLTGPSVLDGLSEPIAARLALARQAVAVRASIAVDSPRTPAWQRYTGHLYRAGGDALAAALREGVHVLILSGGFGLLRAEEPIPWYDRALRLGDWPGGLLAEALADYAARQGIPHVRAFAAATSSYGKVLQRVVWPPNVCTAFRLSPTGARGGAMVLVGRAIGEALSGLLRGEVIDAAWRSTDGLRMTVAEMSCAR